LGKKCYNCGYYDPYKDVCDLANLEFEFGGKNCPDYKEQPRKRKKAKQ
jgi:hypothetical protein